MISRRGLITGLISLAAAPAIIRASSLMPVKTYDAAVWNFLPEIESYNGMGYWPPHPMCRCIIYQSFEEQI